MKKIWLHLKTFLVLLLTLPALSVCYSQDISIGLQGGFNRSRLNGAGPGYFADGGLTAFQIGAFCQFRFSKFAIQPEVNYLQQGTVVDINPEATIKLNYFCVPLMFKLFLLKNQFYIQAGPQFGLLTSYKDDQKHVYEGFKNSNISLNFGFGIELPSEILIDIRYSMGMSQIDKSGYEEIETRTIMLSLGYKIDLKKE